MTQIPKLAVKVAILDLYNGIENGAIKSFMYILDHYKAKHGLNLSYEVFDVRKKVEVPDTNFDIYISSGGPGDPIESEGSEWEKKYFGLIDKLEDHNLSNTVLKKHGLFVCHSFQLMCRKYQLGDVNMRNSASFGVLPVHRTHAAINEPVFENMDDPFYALDSRLWQVINPNEKKFTDLGMQLLAIEKERPHVDFPRAMMAIRFSDYFFSTQFHPEANVANIRTTLLKEEKKQEVVREHGLDKYNEMLECLDDPDKITHTNKTMIPNFLNQAVLSLQEM